MEFSIMHLAVILFSVCRSFGCGGILCRSLICRSLVAAVSRSYGYDFHSFDGNGFNVVIGIVVLGIRALFAVFIAARFVVAMFSTGRVSVMGGVVITAPDETERNDYERSPEQKTFFHFFSPLVFHRQKNMQREQKVSRH
jgi:hypothetical protein